MHLYLNTSINVFRAAKGKHIKTVIYKITIYFRSFAIKENACCFMFFYFALLSKIASEKSVNQLIKNKRPYFFCFRPMICALKSNKGNQTNKLLFIDYFN